MIATLQGAYYILIGLWPIIDITSFEKVFGNKTDNWLVKMTGLILAVIGFVLISSPDDTYRLLGMLIAAAIAIVDIVYTVKNALPLVYIGDAVIQIVFFAVWWIV
jgi:hypothetical protein